MIVSIQFLPSHLYTASGIVNYLGYTLLLQSFQQESKKTLKY